MQLSILSVSLALALVASCAPLHDGVQDEKRDFIAAPRATRATTVATTGRTTGTASPGTRTTGSETRSLPTQTSGRSSTSPLSSLVTSSVRPGASQSALPSSAASSSVLSSASRSASASASASASSASTVPLTCPIPGKPARRNYHLDSRRVNKRALAHPPGKSDVTLFHGTDETENAQSFSREITLRTKGGDLHDEDVAGVDGGLYMTDSFMAAAQFACRSLMPGPPGEGTDEAFVVEFRWLGSGLPVKDFGDDAEYDKFLKRHTTGRTSDMEKIMTDNAMISGPMKTPNIDYGLTDDFWQYAVIKMQPIKDGKLTYVAAHRVLCRNIPVENDLSSDDYVKGQRCDSDFPLILRQAVAQTGTVDWNRRYYELHPEA